MKREVRPELLDSLPPEDPRAIQSRLDLRKVNWWMGHGNLMHRLLTEAFPEHPPRSLIELGAGDGTLLLRLAKRLGPEWKPGRVILVDRQGLLTAETQSRFKALGWTVESVQGDVFDWLGRADREPYDVCLANLFLHHFAGEKLERLLRLAAQHVRVFIACEPRRGHFTLGATNFLPLLGCNSLSVHDGKISVRAGFAGEELSALWPAAGDTLQAASPHCTDGGTWRLVEKEAGLFSHCFFAQWEPSRPSP